MSIQFLDLYHAIGIRIGRRVRIIRLPNYIGEKIHTMHRIKQYGLKEGLRKPWKDGL